MEILGIIPGRKGSKGVLNKNIRKINGKPLVSYSIEAALDSKYIKKVVVSSDSDEILEIANSYDVEFIKRPEYLAQDDSTIVDGIKYTLDVFKESNNYFPEILVLLQPTSPLRDSNDIDEAIKMFLEDESTDSLISVSKFNHNPLWSLKIENDFLSPAFKAEFLNKRRQELPDLFLPNGAIYIIKTSKLMEKNSFFLKKTKAFLMNEEKSLDIDTELDLKLVKCLLKNNK
ncbi:MAG: acylneuraminate cytidylyltransferase family protein [Methanobrevibacter sp.]|nr:acylneuraminate cytidylyltransferase family protein [Methanobrevibacter sp.]